MSTEFFEKTLKPIACALVLQVDAFLDMVPHHDKLGGDLQDLLLAQAVFLDGALLGPRGLVVPAIRIGPVEGHRQRPHGIHCVL